MNRFRLSRSIRVAVLLLASLLLPAAASSLDLFEGNLGTDGEWLHVIGAGAMTDRVLWQDLGPGFTYDVQFSPDEAFAQVAWSASGISDHGVAPDLAPGSYFFRVREVDDSGVTGGWSPTGTLEVVEDTEFPRAEIVSPRGGSFAPGDTVRIAVEVSDDTVLHIARFEVDGEYVGAVGLKTESFKVKPSFGEPRTATFDYTVPAGKTGGLAISVVVSDVTYKQVIVTSQTDAATGRGARKARGDRKK